ncbi:MAG: hypothetical protein EOM66_08965, partial [Clostridia bacterium]|nr:hypothetical protein [Clostridia bacterium]
MEHFIVSKIKMIQKTTVKKPMILYCEILYGFDIFVIAFGTALMTKSGWGNSAGTSFAYILNSLYPAFSFGVWSYLFQGFITLLMIGIIKRVKIDYLLSFVTSMLIGYCLDFSMWLLRFWNPQGLFLSGASYVIGFSILGAGG